MPLEPLAEYTSQNRQQQEPPVPSPGLVLWSGLARLVRWLASCQNLCEKWPPLIMEITNDHFIYQLGWFELWTSPAHTPPSSSGRTLSTIVQYVQKLQSLHSQAVQISRSFKASHSQAVDGRCFKACTRKLSPKFALCTHKLNVKESAASKVLLKSS